MFALGKDLAFVTHYFCLVRGGSQPILARASDGFLYLVKFANNPQGPNLLFNESAGSELYRACGLSVPEWSPLWVSDSFIDGNPDCWMRTSMGRLRPASGLCFGSRFLGLNGRRLFEILPGSMFKRVRKRTSFWLAWLIDICAEHVDHRQAIFVEGAEGLLDAYFVDHGHLFGGPNADLKKRFGVSRYLDQRIYDQISSNELLDLGNVLHDLDADRLRERVGAIPAEWSHASAREGFERCLQRLKMPSLLQQVVDTINYDLGGIAEKESGIVGSERKFPSEILRPGLCRRGYWWNHAHHPNCA